MRPFPIHVKIIKHSFSEENISLCYSCNYLLWNRHTLKVKIIGATILTRL